MPRKLLALCSVLGLTAVTIIACGQAGDDTATGGADLTSADAGDTPIVKAQKALVGAWVTSGDEPTAIILSRDQSGELNVDRDTPHKKQPNDPPETGDRDRADLAGSVTAVDDASGLSGKLTISQFTFGHGDANRENELYTFKIDGKTLTLTETSATFTKHDFGPDGGDTVVDGGPVTIRPPLTLTRQESFCGSGGDSDCAEQFQNGVLTMKMPDACKGREDLCLFCGKQNKCVAQVPSTCELARLTCVESIEKCEFSDPDTGTTGEVTTVDSDGNKVDCKGSHSGKSVCCLQFGRNNRAD